MSVSESRWVADARNRGRAALMGLHGRAAILAYHRVDDLERDPQQLAVSPERFAQQLEVVRHHCTPVSLLDVPRLQRRRMPPRPIVLTFDDGYADNLRNAWPRLASVDVPATVFAATGYTGASREFWWDELDRLLLDDAIGDGRRAPAVTIDGDDVPVASAPQRRAAYHRLAAQLRPAPLDRRNAALVALRRWAGEPDAGTARASYLAMDHEQLATLDSELVGIGAHTRHHLSLAAQPAAVQREEILGSIEDLEAWLNRPVLSFSYPFGTPESDHDAITRRIVARSSIRLATSNHPGPVHALTSRHALPRHLVRDWDASTFEAWLLTEVFPP